MKSPWVLVVAGVDSSGRAGIAADREALAAQEVAMRSVVCVWTCQGSTGVEQFSPLAVEDWSSVAQGELAKGPAVLKFGLLPGAAHVLAAARLAESALARGIPVVLDPVIASSSGFCFLDAAGVAALWTDLLGLGVIVTPNLDEGLALVGGAPGAGPPVAEQRLELAGKILARGAQAVLLKGGHGLEDPVSDLVLERGKQPRWHHHARLPGRSMGGSGCRYASSVAGALARTLSLFEAAELAGRYVARCIEKSQAN